MGEFNDEADGGVGKGGLVEEKGNKLKKTHYGPSIKEELTAKKEAWQVTFGRECITPRRIGRVQIQIKESKCRVHKNWKKERTKERKRSRDRTGHEQGQGKGG